MTNKIGIMEKPIVSQYQKPRNVLYLETGSVFCSIYKLPYLSKKIFFRGIHPGG